MWYSKDWKDYELIDTSDGQRLERWKDVILVRPDPQVIWKDCRKDKAWKNADAVYNRSDKGGGAWDVRNISRSMLDDGWTINYKDLKLKVKPTGFKHTGVFPEQAVNWDFMSEKIKVANRPVSVLNLFAYTGGATVACAKAGAKVCHVDASKGMVAWAKENAALSGLADAPIRYIVDDCKKFIEREIRRGNKYDIIIMDPPSYGRGPGGEIWKLEDDINQLILLTKQLLCEKPLLMLVNSYTTGLSASTVGYLLNLHLSKSFKGVVTADEIGLPVSATGGVLPAGASARFEG